MKHNLHKSTSYVDPQEKSVNDKTKTRTIARTISYAIITIALIIIAFILVNPPVAVADELSDTKEELEQKMNELDEITLSIENVASDIEATQAKIDEKAAQAIEIEETIIKNQEVIGSVSKYMYRNGSFGLIEFVLNSDNANELFSRVEIMFNLADELAEAITSMKQSKSTLEDEMTSLSTLKDEQQSKKHEFENQKLELSATIAELRTKAGALTAQQRIALSEAEGKSVAFDTVFDDDLGGWRTGKASAYGDGSDSHTTAMGTSIDNTPAIAVPMSWPNYRSYFGKHVEISYNGKSVIGIISDCGGFGPYGRDLDISYTVIRAWGFYTTDDWGVRTVKWRVL